MITSYDGEFGYELIGVVPYAYYLHLQHLLVKTESCKDTKALYYFSPQHLETFVERRFNSSGFGLGAFGSYFP